MTDNLDRLARYPSDPDWRGAEERAAWRFLPRMVRETLKKSFPRGTVPNPRISEPRFRGSDGKFGTSSGLSVLLAVRSLLA